MPKIVLFTFECVFYPRPHTNIERTHKKVCDVMKDSGEKRKFLLFAEKSKENARKHLREKEREWPGVWVGANYSSLFRAINTANSWRQRIITKRNETENWFVCRTSVNLRKHLLRWKSWLRHELLWREVVYGKKGDWGLFWGEGWVYWNCLIDVVSGNLFIYRKFIYDVTLFGAFLLKIS